MSTEIKHKTSNPGPLGLLGFGMTTVLLNLHNAGYFPNSIIVVAMGIAMGGLAQVIAGIFELKHGNTFAGTAFTAYGLFWWSLVIIWVNPFADVASIAPADATYLAFYLLLWGIFTTFMFIGTLKHNKATQVVFGSLFVLASSLQGLTILATFITCVADLLCVVAVVVMRKKYPDLERPFKVPGYKFVTPLTIIIFGAIVVNTVVTNLNNVALAFIVPAIAVVMWFVFGKVNKNKSV